MTFDYRYLPAELVAPTIREKWLPAGISKVSLRLAPRTSLTQPDAALAIFPKASVSYSPPRHLLLIIHNQRGQVLRNRKTLLHSQQTRNQIVCKLLKIS